MFQLDSVVSFLPQTIFYLSEYFDSLLHLNDTSILCICDYVELQVCMYLNI